MEAKPMLLTLLLLLALVFTPSLVSATRDPRATKSFLLQAVLGQSITKDVNCEICGGRRRCCDPQFPTCCGLVLCCRFAYICCNNGNGCC